MKKVWFPEKTPDLVDSNTCYKSAWLWLPKAKVNVAGIRAACTATTEDHKGRVIPTEFYSEWGDHILVPREFIPWEALPKPAVDLSVSGMPVKFESSIKLRPSQVPAWTALNAVDSGILNLGCGHGKTVLALHKAAVRGKATIAIMNQGGLLDQWRKEAQAFLGLAPRDIGLIRQERFEWNRPFVIASIQTLARRLTEGRIPWEMRTRFGTVIYDEVHHLSAPHFVLTAPLFPCARIGLSATPDRNDGLEIIYMAHIGQVFYSDLTHEIDPKIFFVHTETTVDMADARVTDCLGEFNVSKLRSFLSEDLERNTQILSHIAQASCNGRRVLALSHSRKHVEALAAAVPGSGLITGGVPFNDRCWILRQNKIIFATNGVAEEGLDAPHLDTVMFLTPFKNWNTFQQGVGRALRVAEGKRRPVATVFWDWKIGPANAMCRSLMRALKNHGWEYSVLQS